MTFLERVHAWLNKRPPEPTGHDLQAMVAERQRQLGEAFAEEMARRVALGNPAYFPGDGDGPRAPQDDPPAGFVRW